jgi:thiol-disulfide isomerase/thioredoxin
MESKEGSMIGIVFCLALSTVSAAPADTDVIAFVAPSCPHCRQLTPHLEELKNEGYRIYVVDATIEKTLVEQYKIERVPTIVVLRNRQETDRIVGRLSYTDLLKRLPTATDKEQPNPFPLLSPSGGNPANSSTTGNEPRTSTTPPNTVPPTLSVSGVTTAAAVMPLAQKGMTASSAPATLDPRSLSATPAATGVTTGATQPREFPTLQALPSALSTSSAPNHAPSNMAASTIAEAQSRAISATVRLRIESPQTQANGTGTVIQVDRGNHLILTCGHLFRDMKAEDKLFVDYYRDGQWYSAEGRVVQFFADERDIGVVTCVSTVPVEPVAINYADTLAPQTPAFSIGCDRGTPPTLQSTTIVALNRYLGPANIEITGAPVDGRSGGGLFNAAGQLIGVCNAADHQDNEGIYAGQLQILNQLQSLGLQIPSATMASQTALAGYQQNNSMTQPETVNPALGNAADLSLPATQPATYPNGNNASQTIAPATQSIAELETTRGQNRTLEIPATATNQESFSQPALPSTSTPEVVVIVRDGTNPPREVRVPKPSPELLRWIAEQAAASIPHSLPVVERR